MATEVSAGKESIQKDVVTILEGMTRDWDLQYQGGITAETRLIADLAFESIDVVQFVVALEEQFKRRDLPFERLLMEDGRYVSEIKVGEAVEFLHKHMNGA
ncbi:MAG: acyl carrier protein [Candidatus Polarisedimenticolia bacterium]